VSLALCDGSFKKLKSLTRQSESFESIVIKNRHFMKKLALLSLALFASCQKRGMDSASMFSKSGMLKEKIALVSMIDSSQNESSWDICDELTSYLHKDLARKDTLYVVPVKNEVSLSCTKNPFSDDTGWIQEHFSHMSYVVFTELLKYEKTQDDLKLSDQLSVSLRVRVFKNSDHGFSPILQEIVQQNYTLPALLSTAGSLVPAYGSQGYDLSPIGSSHQKFCDYVASRIRDYIKE
jgi:hypothetical protein